LVKKHR